VRGAIGSCPARSRIQAATTVGKRATSIVAFARSAAGEMSAGFATSSESADDAMRSVSMGGAPFAAASRTIAIAAAGSARSAAISPVSFAVSAADGRRPVHSRCAACSKEALPASSLSS